MVRGWLSLGGSGVDGEVGRIVRVRGWLGQLDGSGVGSEVGVGGDVRVDIGWC